MASEPARKKCKHADISPGDILSEVQYYQVLNVTDDLVDVRNERGFEFEMTSSIVEEGSWSANQFTKTVKVSRTKLVEHLLNAKASVFTVNFNKKPNAESHSNVLKSATIQDLTDPVKLKNLSQRLELGEERTLVGHLLESEIHLGRSKVIDLEEHFAGVEERKHDPNSKAKWTVRLVDHRHINWLILNGVKYVVK